jgi:hypothetical protein
VTDLSEPNSAEAEEPVSSTPGDELLSRALSDQRGAAIARIVVAMATLVTALTALLQAVSNALTASVALFALATIWLVALRLTRD